MPMPDSLSFGEQTKVDLRAQRIYQRTSQVLPWGNIAESTRSVFRDRAKAEMWQDGTLLFGPPDGGDDDGYLKLLELDAEAAEVIHGGN